MRSVGQLAAMGAAALGIRDAGREKVDPPPARTKSKVSRPLETYRAARRAKRKTERRARTKRAMRLPMSANGGAYKPRVKLSQRDLAIKKAYGASVAAA